MWFSYILGSNFSFLCLGLIMIQYHTQRQFGITRTIGIRKGKCNSDEGRVSNTIYKYRVGVCSFELTELRQNKLDPVDFAAFLMVKKRFGGVFF